MKTLFERMVASRKQRFIPYCPLCRDQAYVAESRNRHLKRCVVPSLAGIAGYHLYRHGLFPPITMLQDVMREDIGPGDERNKNDDH